MNVYRIVDRYNPIVSQPFSPQVVLALEMLGYVERSRREIIGDGNGSRTVVYYYKHREL